MDQHEAIKATRNGAVAAMISAAVTIIFVGVAMTSDAGGKLALWNDPMHLVDVFLILGCAYGIYRKSRIAAVLLFVYFIAAKIIIAIETQAFSGLGVALVFLYFFGKAIQGSFVYHRLAKEDDPEHRATTKWTYILGIPSALIVIVLIAYALMSTTGVVPSTRVQSTDEIKSDDLAMLVSHGIISPEDKVEYFYSQGLSSILEGGNILTVDRVILYITDKNEELQVYELPVEEVVDVSLESQGNTFNDSVYKVSTNDPKRWLKLFLSVEQKGDQKFIRALRGKMKRGTQADGKL